MIPIKFKVGDATRPEGEGVKVLCHIVNNIGAWGAGFTGALSARSAIPEADYRLWSKSISPVPFTGGNVIFSPFLSDGKGSVLVASMLAQHGVGAAKCCHCVNGQHSDHGDCIHCNGKGFIPPLNYLWLGSCLRELRRTVLAVPYASVHMPRIGCGLGGGSWEKVEPLVSFFLSYYDVPVTVYDLPHETTA